MPNLIISNKNCQANLRKQKYRKKRKNFIDQLKIARNGGQCQQCDYNNCLEALHFHHRNPKLKKFKLSESEGYSEQEVIKEAKKCDLLCANHHLEKHFGLRKDFIHDT